VKKASDLLSVTFSDINALILSRLTTRKSSTGGVKYVAVEEFARQLEGEYAEALSDDLNDAFISTIDTTFALLQALDPGAHIGGASSAFTESIADSLINAFSSGEFGLDLDSMVSVEGLSSSEAAERISIYFNGLSDDMINAIFPVLDQFRLAGEELGDTLARMVAETSAATTAFSVLGFEGSIFDPSVMGTAGIEANNLFQQGLFEGFSDISQWSELTNSFTEAILTEAELIDNKISLIEADLAAGFSRSVTDILKLPEIEGLSNLKSEISFLAKELRTGSVTAAQAMGGLRTVWEDVSQVVSNASSGFSSTGAALSDTDFNSLGNLVSGVISTGDALSQLIGLQEDKTIANAAAETGAALQDYLAVIQGLRDTISSMLLGDLSPLSKGAKLTLAKGEFDDLVKAVETEPEEGKRLELISDLESHALEYLNASKEYYAGTGNYVDTFDTVKGILEQIEGGLQQTADSMAEEDESLNVLKDSYNLQQAMADDMRAGISNLISAIEAIKLGGSTSGAAVTTALTQTYQNALGRAPDPEGLAFWEKAVKDGHSLSSVTNEIANSPEGVTAALTGKSSGVSQLNPALLDIYSDELGRTPDPEGYLYWQERLDSGMPIEEVRNYVATSPEALGLPTFADGGITSGISIAGEAGAEAVVPLPNGRSIPVDLGTPAGVQDNTELLMELRKIRESLDQLNATSEENMSDVIDTLSDSNALASVLVSNTNNARGGTL